MKEDIYYVYEWIRLDTNEPFYIGKGKNNRWKSFNERNEYFKRIVNKYQVVVNILHDNLDEQTAFGLENYYIWLYRDIIGYEMCNFNDGGEGQTLCGENNPMYGKGHLLEGENNPMYGKHHTEESKRKMSEKKIGKYNNENNPMYGKKHTEEAKEKNRISNSGRNHIFSKCVICITTKKIFYSVREASRYYNVPHNNISKCCKKDGYKTAGKLSDGTPLKWAYIEVVQL